MDKTPESEYSQHICGGAHCKCMNVDGRCEAFHKGDHTCLASTPTPDSQELDPVKELKEQMVAILLKKGALGKTPMVDQHNKAYELIYPTKDTLDELVYLVTTHDQQLRERLLEELGHDHVHLAMKCPGCVVNAVLPEVKG